MQIESAMQNEEGDSNIRRKLGIAHDVVSFGDRGAAWGFDIAKFATNTGFGIASACICAPAAVLEQTVGANPVSSTFRNVDAVVSVAHKATSAGQNFARSVTQTSLGVTKAGLVAAGAQEGELLRLALGDEAAEAVTVVEATVRRFAGSLTDVDMTNLLYAARAWGALQHAATMPDVDNGEVTVLPVQSERWMRFTAATFGAAWFAGLVEGFSLSAAARAHEATERGGGPAEAALACAGIDGHVETLAFEQRTHEFFAPGYMVAVDHEYGYVVVALRGTSSMKDIVADLVCEPAAVQLGGVEGIAHGGMLKAAQHLDETLAVLTERGLSKLRMSGRMNGQQPRIMICGHSLGAGVAALLAALWRDNGRFQGVEFHCMSFACPQVLDAGLAAAVSNFTTSIIVGNDLVPRFSLATAHDLREAMLHLNNPVAYGHDPSFCTKEVLAAESRGDTASLATAYSVLRPIVCSAPGRLFPAGHLIHLIPGRTPLVVPCETFDELRVTSDMASAHMPGKYLSALQDVAAQGE